MWALRWTGECCVVLASPRSAAIRGRRRRLRILACLGSPSAVSISEEAFVCSSDDDLLNPGGIVRGQQAESEETWVEGVTQGDVSSLASVSGCRCGSVHRSAQHMACGFS